MIIKIRDKTNRILNKNIKLSNIVYNTLKDIEIFLDQAYFRGHMILDGDENKFILSLHPVFYINEFELNDLHDQINYLIKCNKELKLPFEVNQ